MEEILNLLFLHRLKFSNYRLLYLKDNLRCIIHIHPFLEEVGFYLDILSSTPLLFDISDETLRIEILARYYHHHLAIQIWSQKISNHIPNHRYL